MTRTEAEAEAEAENNIYGLVETQLKQFIKCLGGQGNFLLCVWRDSRISEKEFKSIPLAASYRPWKAPKQSPSYSKDGIKEALSLFPFAAPYLTLLLNGTSNHLLFFHLY